MKVFACIAATAALVAFAAPASAQFAKPEDAIKYRQSVMTVMASHFGRVAAMANGRIPFNAQAAADNVAIAETMSKLPWQAFVPGSEAGNSKALPTIWTDAAKFKTAQDNMLGEMNKLAVAAKGGNIDAIKAAVGATGGTCKACHDAFWKQ